MAVNVELTLMLKLKSMLKANVIGVAADGVGLMADEAGADTDA